MKTYILAIIAISFFLLHGCKQSEKDEEKATTKAIPQEQLIAKIGMLQDSAKAAWSLMMQTDDQKISFVKRLLDEVSYMPKYDILVHERLVQNCKKLKAKRFDENSFLQSRNIDSYDSATDSLLKEVKLLVLSIPNVENYPLCGDLLNDITALDNDVVLHRVKYDAWAMQYNQIIDEQREAIAQMGSQYANLKKMGLFQLGQ